MLNMVIGSYPIGPEGIYGEVQIAFVNGKLVSSVTLSPKGIMDEAAKKAGGPIPAEVAHFMENAIGLG